MFLLFDALNNQVPEKSVAANANVAAKRTATLVTKTVNRNEIFMTCASFGGFAANFVSAASEEDSGVYT
jgi:hypothetical protein